MEQCQCITNNSLKRFNMHYLLPDNYYKFVENNSLTQSLLID